MFIYRLLSILIIVTGLLLTNTHPAESAQCSYFNETFTGSASNTWVYKNATWAIKNGELNVTGHTGSNLAYASSTFSPAAYFTVDVDTEAVSLAQSNGSYGLYVYTTGTTYFTVNGKSLDGVAVFIYPNNTALITAWDITNSAWYGSDTLTLSSAPTSIGLEFSSTGVTARINGQNTALKFSAAIPTPSIFDTIWLTAYGSGAFFITGTEINFDNVCSDPLASAVTQYTLTAAKSGTGSGTVASSPSGISCGSDCSEKYNSGTQVTLTATADSGSTFSGWSGGGCSGTGSCSVTVGADTTVTASFTTSGSSTGGSCTATIDQSLKLNIPIIKYTDPIFGSIYLWADMEYVLNPSKVLFKLSDYGTVQNGAGYTCTMSTIDSDLAIHVVELLFGGPSYWLTLSYDKSLSSGSNLYFYASDYGVNSSAITEDMDVTELTSSLFGAAGRYDPGTTPAIISTIKTAYQAGGVTALINLATAAYPQLVTAIPNGILIDYGTGYTALDGSTMTGSIQITHSNVVRTGTRTTGNFSIFASNVHKNAKFLGDGSATGTVDLTSDANNKVKGDITINGTINSSGVLKSPLANGTGARNITSASGTVAGSAHFDETICPNYPVSGSVTFTVSGQTQTITFNSNCDGSYATNGVTQGGSPVITTLSPDSGQAGDTVTISGSGFGAAQGTSTVKFVGTAATIVSWSNTAITVKVPNITSTGDVIVNVGGKDSNGVTFTLVNLCSTQQVAGADTPETRVIDLGKTSGTFKFDYETYSQKDNITVTYAGATLFSTGCVGANGSQNITFSGSSTFVTVSVQPNCAGGSGTAWNFKVYCP